MLVLWIYIWNYRCNRTPNNNFVNLTDKEPDKMMLNSNFKYYDNHEFHKLKQKWSNNRNFSIFHTNIYLLQANSDKLELLTNNLNHDFNVIALSETWTSENNIFIWSAIFSRLSVISRCKGKTNKKWLRFLFEIRNKIQTKKGSWYKLLWRKQWISIMLGWDPTWKTTNYSDWCILPTP